MSGGVSFTTLCPFCDEVIDQGTVTEDGSYTSGDHRPHSIVAHPERYASLPTVCGYDAVETLACLYGCTPSNCVVIGLARAARGVGERDADRERP